MRRIVGLLLIVAALLKALELYQHPSSVLGDSYSRFLTPLLVGSELGLGLFAIAGLYWRQLRLLAMILFASFACYSLLLALQGAASCGCFGQLEINPWWTFLLDIAVFAGLFLERLTKGRDNKTSDNSTRLPARVRIVGIVMTSLAVAFGLARHAAPRPASSQDRFQTVGDLIIFEPETWVGKVFPLLEHIDIDVSQGKWVLLMHRHDCPKCREAVPKYERLAMPGTHCQVGIIEVPPYDTLHEVKSSHCRVGRLSADRDWFVETPIEIQLADGLVVSASTDLPFLNDFSVAQKVGRNVRLLSAGRRGHQLEDRGGAKQ